MLTATLHMIKQHTAFISIQGPNLLLLLAQRPKISIRVPGMFWNFSPIIINTQHASVLLSSVPGNFLQLGD